MVRFYQIFLNLQVEPQEPNACYRTWDLDNQIPDTSFPNHEFVLAYYIGVPPLTDFYWGTMIHFRGQRIDIMSRFFSWYCFLCQQLHHHFTENVVRMPAHGNYRVFCNCENHVPTNHIPPESDLNVGVVPDYDEDGIGQSYIVSRCHWCQREHTYEMYSGQRFDQDVRRVNQYRCSGDFLNSGLVQADRVLLDQGGPHHIGGHDYDATDDLRFLFFVLCWAWVAIAYDQENHAQENVAEDLGDDDDGGGGNAASDGGDDTDAEAGDV